MSLTIEIDQASCIGQADCAEVLPDVFVVDDTATVVGTGPDDLLIKAARLCPTEAILLVDQETGERVFP